MTPDEIQALREKHYKDVDGNCFYCERDSRYWEKRGYPCDTIKVLDAYEAEKKAESEAYAKAWGLAHTAPRPPIKIDPTRPVETVDIPKCDHIWVNKAGSTYRAYPVEVCIKCYAEHTRSAIRTCTHYGVDLNGSDYYGTSNPPQETDWNYNYCPWCGADLQEESKL